MLSLSILAFSLLSNALSVPQNSGLNARSSLLRTSRDALTPVTQLRVSNEFIAPDGYNRSATLVNGVYPGPLIQAQKNDNFSVYVVNNLTDPTMPLQTSIHWHGIFQHRSNWADGIAYVSQCPIPQEEAFTYQFNVSGQSGTYWYHSHYSTQYCDGLRGPLVIYDPEDPLRYLYDVDDENTVITLSDWYHVPSPKLDAIFTSRAIANSTLINGRGRYSGGPAVPLSVVNVQKGLRYRFRIVATSCDPHFNFTIDGHRMIVIEADGNEVDPVEVDSLTIYAGQRYSVVVEANQAVGNYWIRAPNDEPYGATFEGGQNMAILRYVGAPYEDPTSEPSPNELALSEADLHPLMDPAAPGIPEIGKADVNIQLNVGYKDFLFELNDVSYVNPTVPVLLQILSGAVHPSQLLPNGSVYELPFNKVIEISFQNPTAAPGFPHPIHLHGHAFSVVRLAGSNETNFLNPVRRDVVSIGGDATDNVVIRFVTDNPGPWFLHCHIDWHLNHGFAVVMAEAPVQTLQEEAPVVPQDWRDLCPPRTSSVGSRCACGAAEGTHFA